ncbi:MAG: hypothetical protein BWK73_41660, partial [Thiothrix lacustris]
MGNYFMPIFTVENAYKLTYGIKKGTKAYDNGHTIGKDISNLANAGVQPDPRGGNTLDQTKAGLGIIFDTYNLTAPSTGWNPIEQLKDLLFKRLDQMDEHYKREKAITDAAVSGNFSEVDRLQQQAAEEGRAATIAPTIRRDPLALDLDGDGIETTGTSDKSVFFDHDADGIKSRTGWLKSDDGWLVLDRNKNGKIDTGRELFGVDTLLKDGSKALDGFSALKDEDKNNDNVIDKNDSIFNQLLIWKDLNQDGISQTNELTSLTKNQIISVGLDTDSVWKDLGNGNVQTAAGVFTKTNNQLGKSGETSPVVNLDLLLDNFRTQFTDHITLTSQAKALPNLLGSGNVRNLDEAISLSSKLGATVEAYSKLTTRNEQLAMLDTFIREWSDTAESKSLQDQALILKDKGVSLTYDLQDIDIKSTDYSNFFKKLGVVEKFMGFTYGGVSGGATFETLNEKSGAVTVTLSQTQIEDVVAAYDLFKSYIYTELLTQTRLSPYVNAMIAGLSWTMPSAWTPEMPPLAWIDSTIFENLIDRNILTQGKEGYIDLIEFVVMMGESTFKNLNWDINTYLASKLGNMPNLGKFHENLGSWNIIIDNSDTYGTFGNDIIVNSSGSSHLIGNDGDDIIISSSGNDHMYGGDGNDKYQFSRQSGQDFIHNFDNSSTSIDSILLDYNISENDLILKRSANNLIININGSSASTEIQGYFDEDAKTSSAIDFIQFADATKWDINAIKAKALLGTAGADSLLGYASNDLLKGEAGDDQLYGAAGND